MQIRDVTPAEILETTTLWQAAGLTRPWNPPEEDFARALDGPTSTILGAFDANSLMGTVMVGHDGHRGWIYYLAVAETHRGSGLGRQLMAAAEHWLRTHRVVKVQLMVRSSNDAVLGFYDRLGYENVEAQVRSKWLS
ncbi:MAG TPA: GNAT family acetyltransferase [Glaciihabitans sp.]|jgi:ribosomal protein S18 acetylase RimI-like enzyme|nr:GNAT family acetyltransferase [Glaciihabitans sp.]